MSFNPNGREEIALDKSAVTAERPGFLDDQDHFHTRC